MGRHRRTRKEKNIRKDEATDEWIVYKKFKHLKQPHIYRRFKTFREAKSYRNMLDKKDAWISELPPDKRVTVLKRGNNYYTTKNGSAYIYKTQNYTQIFYGCYASKEDAEKVVHHLVLNDWEWDNLPEEIKSLRLSTKQSESKQRYLVKNGAGHLVVRRYIYGENRNYGAYPDKPTADKVIEWLNENDWTLDLPDWIINLQCLKRKPKYYSKTSSGKYSVNKYINSRPVHFGSYSTPSDAENAVEQLKKHNWDYQWFQDHKKTLNCNPQYTGGRVKK